MSADDADATTLEAFGLQCVLRSVAASIEALAHERVTAHVLSIWIGTNDIDIMCLHDRRPWLAEVIGGFVWKYRLTPKNFHSVNLQESYDSVIYNLEKSDMKQVNWSMLI